jgi:glycosyltransferase involved in cell wall biosynthesis
VAIFTDNDFGKVNGVTTSLRAVLSHLPGGMAARIYTASEFGDDLPKYFALPSASVRMPFYRDMRMYLPHVGRFLRQVRLEDVDLIHLTTPGPVGLTGMFVAWQTGLRMVGSFHTDLAAYARILSGSKWVGRLMRQYLRWPYGKCDRILVPSESTRQLLIAEKFNAGKLDICRRGVDTQLFAPEKRSCALREKWRVCDRRPAAIYVGRLSEEKGLQQFAAIQSALYRCGAQHRLILVGDGPFRRELQAQLPDTIFTGMLKPAEVAIALASADVFLFPSETDAAGNAVLEAQASGLPVVVTNQGGPREYMRPEVTGFVCPGDPDAFGAAAAAALRNAPLRREMAQAAREHALTLRWETALEPLYSAYRAVARGSLIDEPMSRASHRAPGNVVP